MFTFRVDFGRQGEQRVYFAFRDFGRLTTDVISSCAFGIDSGCIQDENSRFLIESRKIFDSMEKLPLRLRIILPIMREIFSILSAYYCNCLVVYIIKMTLQMDTLKPQQGQRRLKI